MSVHNLKQGVEFVFIRHAESESNAEIHSGNIDNLTVFDDVRLTERGFEQAKQVYCYVKEALATRTLMRMLTSPQQRAIDTCKKLKPIFSDRFAVEPCIFEYRSPPQKDLVTAHGVCTVDKTWGQFWARVRLFRLSCEKIVRSLSEAELDTKPVVVVFGHSLFISAFLTLCCSDDNADPPEDGQALSFHIPNASSTSVFYNTEMWSVLHVGSTDHLSPDLRIKHTNF